MLFRSSSACRAALFGAFANSAPGPLEALDLSAAALVLLGTGFGGNARGGSGMVHGETRSTRTDSLCVCEALLPVTVNWKSTSELAGK